MVKQARPAVVRIETNSGSGSGAIYEVDGRTAYIITNQHVVESYNRVEVTVNDRDEYQGEVLGADSVRDLAVVKICCGDFTRLLFGNTSGLEPGDEVVIIGYALGMQGEATVSRGIVSAIRYDSSYQSDVIQTDAAINPGNSGGPMLSLSGEILGINTFKISETDVEGLGFAISVTTVQKRIPALQSEIAQPVVTPTRTPRPSTGGTNSFGPVSGELAHDPADGFIKTEYADVSMADMIVEATFTNPYSSGYSSWDYGLNIRDPGEDSEGSFIEIVVTDESQWEAQTRNSDLSYSQMIGGGTLGNLYVGEGDKNHLRVVAVGQRGWFFVNGEFIASLDLSDVKSAGNVAVITGAFEGDEVTGAVTKFEDFSITRLNKRYGPAGGILEKDSEFIALHDSDVWTQDLVMEADFINPQGDGWDYGFIIRNPESERLEVIGLAGIGWWFHNARDTGDEEYSDLADGWLSDTDGFSYSRNNLLLIAVGDSGWFFINGELVDRLDLSHNLDSGWVALMSHFFEDSRGSPEFENFNVWAP